MELYKIIDSSGNLHYRNYRSLKHAVASFQWSYGKIKEMFVKQGKGYSRCDLTPCRGFLLN